jgi:Flp pilus assembly protein TadD
MSEERSATPARRALFAVACAAVLAGLPSLAPGFIHDDHRIIEQNELIRDPRRIPEILTRGYWTVDENAVPNLYRPVTILSFAASHAVGGLEPAGYRAVNLALHALVAALVYLLARRVLGGAGAPGQAALLAGLLFALHPIHTEALGLVVGRSDILAAAGTLGAVLLFLGARDCAAAGDQGGALRRDALALLAFGLGFLAKENAVAAPFIVLAADLTRPWRAGVVPAGRPPRAARGGPQADARPRPAWRTHAAFAVVLAALVALRTAVLGTIGPAAFTHFVDNPIAHQPFPESLFTGLAVLARYARLLVAPVHLAVDYSYAAIEPLRSLLSPWALAGLGLAMAGVIAGLRSWRRRPAEAFALAFTALAFAPVSNLVVPIGTIMAERLLYLPSAGVVILAAAWAARIPAVAAGGSRAAGAVAAAILLACGVLSVARLFDWRDERTLFRTAVAAQPRSARAQFNYGAASERAGSDADAQQAYETAIGIWPDFADAHYNLAGLLARQTRWDDAVAHYRESLRLRPESVASLVNLGATLTRAGRPAEAIGPLERAAALEPESDRAWNSLGAARLALGRPAEAAAAWRESARLNPRNADYAANLALALETAGDPEVIAAWEAAIALRPGDGLLRYRLGLSLERGGRDDDAAVAYRESARLAPASPVPYKALGLLLVRRGERDAARAALERAAALDTGGTVMDAAARRVLEDLRAAGR